MRPFVPALTWCLFSAAIVAVPAHAATPFVFCTANFANVARSPDEIRAISTETYGKLLDLVQDADVKRRVLEHIVAKNDPFSLPTNERDLTALEKPLREFGKMLKDLKWESPELAVKMVEVARSRVQVAEVAKEKVEQASEKNVAIKRLNFPLPESDFSKQSPDGRYFYTVVKTAKGADLITYDTVTEKSETTPFPLAHGASGYAMAVTADGAKLVLGVNRNKDNEENQVFYVHELVNGKPNPKGKRIEVSPRLDAESAKAAKAETPIIQSVTKMENPDWVFTEVFHDAPDGERTMRYHVVDLAQGKTFPIDPVSTGGWLAPIEGTNAFAVIGKRPGARKPMPMQVFEVGPNGKATVKDFTLHEGVPDQVPTVQGHGDRIALPDEKKGEVVVLNWRTGDTVRFVAPRPQKNPVRPHGHIHPNGKEVAIMEIDQTKMKHRVIWYEIATGKKIAEFDLPLGSVEFSPDGESIIARGDDRVSVLPVMSLLSGAARP